MISSLLSIPGAILAVGLLVLIHEWGHFIAGRIFGVQARVFSVGFGPRLWGFGWKGTDYRISWLPFGGYVRWAGADPFMEGGIEEDVEPVARHAQFMYKPAWQRLLIMLAGPAMNLVLPFLLFGVLMVAGQPQPRAVLGTVVRDAPAGLAGARPGDTVTGVDGTPVLTWPDLVDALEAGSGSRVVLTLERDGVTRTLTVALPAGSERSISALGIDPAGPSAVLGVDDPDSPAWRAGLRTGDTLVAVDGRPVEDWNAARARLEVAGATVRLELAGEDGATRELSVAAQEGWAAAPAAVDDAVWRRFGIAPGGTFIGEVQAGSAAERAGLRPGDRVLEVFGRAVHAWDDVTLGVAAAGEGEDQDLVALSGIITVRRAGEVLALSATPDVVRDTDALARFRWRPFLGIGPAAGMVLPESVPRPYPIGQAVTRAVDETVSTGALMLELLGGILTYEVDATETVGGPIAMFQQARAAAERGLGDFVQLIGLLSLSLGIINLLPVPVLDGGQILIYGAEWLRGRPLPLVFRERAQQIGVIFLVALMFAVVVNDIHRIVTG